MPEELNEEYKISPQKQIVSYPVVYKQFVRKNLEKTDIMEMYLQGSSQDFFIKFCESVVSRNKLEQHLSTIDGEIKAVKLEVEFREGYWDICDENELMQSRIGRYVVVHQIIN